MEVGVWKLLRGIWTLHQAKKNSKNFKGAQGGTLKMAILVKSPMGAPKKYLNFFSPIQACDTSFLCNFLSRIQIWNDFYPKMFHLGHFGPFWVFWPILEIWAKASNFVQKVKKKLYYRNG